MAFASREGRRASHITAIGALSGVMLGYFDRESRESQTIPPREQGHVWRALEV